MQVLDQAFYACQSITLKCTMLECVVLGQATRNKVKGVESFK